MTVRLIFAVVGMLGVMVSAVFSNILIDEMLDRVNAKLPEQEQISPIFWHYWKLRRLTREYKRLYPDAPLIKKINRLRVILFASSLVMVWGGGFFN